MWTWFCGHVAVILICLGLLALIAGAVAVLIHDKKSGKSSCGGHCACCPMGGCCHGSEKGSQT